MNKSDGQEYAVFGRAFAEIGKILLPSEWRPLFAYSDELLNSRRVLHSCPNWQDWFLFSRDSVSLPSLRVRGTVSRPNRLYWQFGRDYCTHTKSVSSRDFGVVF